MDRSIDDPWIPRKTFSTADSVSSKWRHHACVFVSAAKTHEDYNMSDFYF